MTGIHLLAAIAAALIVTGVVNLAAKTGTEVGWWELYRDVPWWWPISNLGTGVFILFGVILFGVLQ